MLNRVYLYPGITLKSLFLTLILWVTNQGALYLAWGGCPIQIRPGPTIIRVDSPSHWKSRGYPKRVCGPSAWRGAPRSAPRVPSRSGFSFEADPTARGRRHALRRRVSKKISTGELRSRSHFALPLGPESRLETNIGRARTRPDAPGRALDATDVSGRASDAADAPGRARTQNPCVVHCSK